MRRLRLWLARYRLRGHMYDRLIYGGSPDCPCSRCTADRATVLELAGEPWDEPVRAAYYRALEKVIESARRAGAGLTPSARCYPDCTRERCAVADSCVYEGNELP